MENKIKWIHLSDFHVGKDQYEEKKIFKYILEYIEEIVKEGFSPNFIFITGDVANSGLKKEYSIFLDEFLAPLIDILNLDDWEEKIFIVPGNHDIDRSLVDGVTIDKNQKFFNANEDGKNQRLVFEGRAFEDYREFLKNCSLKSQDLFVKNNGAYEQIITINEQKIGIVGINTAWLTRENNDKGNLTPGIDLLENALTNIKECNIKILLGHHPLDWFKSSDKKAIESILSDNKIIYLHGHLHESRVQPLSIGMGTFLQVQAGASFQVPEHSSAKWKNSFLMAELDSKQLRLQPRYWKSVDRRWGILDDLHEDMRDLEDTKWWNYKSPEYCSETSTLERTEQLKNPCPGWAYIQDSFFVNSEKSILSNDAYLKFFDGSLPNWNRTFLRKLPQREGTKEVIKLLIENNSNKDSTFILLSGAGGEGKSTSIMQCVLNLYEKEWSIFWHTSFNPFPESYLLELDKSKPILIVSDDGEQLIENLQKIIELSNKKGITINFLFASRKSDWNTKNGSEIRWQNIIKYKEIQLGKLSLSESEDIIELWNEFGEEGLKELFHLAKGDAIQKLYKSSSDQLEKGDGAFLGAMLNIRLADGLKDHVRNLLARLEEKEISGTNSTLLDAFAVIAHMHIKDLEFLSLPILAQYLFDDSKKTIKTNVLHHLGKEAAANRAGDFVYTRHSIIAKVACELLATEYDFDSSSMYIRLGDCAMQAKKDGYIPNYGFWQYDFSKYFIENNEHITGITIAQKQYENDPSFRSLTHFAGLYREIKDYTESTNLFRTFQDNSSLDRGYYREWSRSERLSGNIELSSILSAVSISDNVIGNPPSNDDAKKAFVNLCLSFHELFERYHNQEYLKSMYSCAILAIKLQDMEEKLNYFTGFLEKAKNEGLKSVSLTEIFSLFEKAIQMAINTITHDKDVREKIPQKKKISFKKLEQLIKDSELRTKKSIIK